MVDKCKIFLDRVTRWHRYGKMTIGRMSLQVSDGEHVLIYGQSQEELTDLFQITVGMTQPDEGTVSIQGPKAVIFEEFPYMETLTVIDYVLLTAQLTGMDRKTAVARARQIITDSPLRDKRSMGVQFLSCYESCLLWLDMTAMISPKVLIMGDLTRNLNAEEERRFWYYAGDYIDQSETTLLCFSGHQDVPFIFDKKYILENNQLKLLP